MILLDTTILVYAVGGEHPLRSPSRTIVEAIGDGRLPATTTVEVIQEFAHVRARRRDREDASRLAGMYVDLLAPLLTPSEIDLRGGLELFARSSGLGPFDAVLAATAIGTSHIHALVSADRAFAAVPGLEVVDPHDEAAVRSLVERR